MALGPLLGKARVEPALLDAAADLHHRVDAVGRGSMWNATGVPDPDHEAGWGVEYLPKGSNDGKKKIEWGRTRAEQTEIQARLNREGHTHINRVIQRGSAKLNFGDAAVEKDQQVYKRYTITKTRSGEYIVHRDNTRICTSKSLEEAKRNIDLVAD